MMNEIVLNDVVDSIVRGDESLFAKLSQEERSFIIRFLSELEGDGDSKLLSSLWKYDFERKPVGIDEFLENEYYLGSIGRDAYPVWRNDLRKIFDLSLEITEWIVGGAIGIGKTWIATIALLYKIYYLTCLRDPQRFFGLSRGSPIIFGLFNILKYLIDGTSYEYFEKFIKLSPYLKSLCISNDAKEKFIGFPHNIGIITGSNAIHALGQNIFGGLLDEANFGRDKGAEDEGQVYEMYFGAKRRMDSRFLRGKGINPCLLIIASSANKKTSFLERHELKAITNPRTLISRYAAYEAKEKEFEGVDRFRVVVGDRAVDSKILEDDDLAPEGKKIIYVPITYKHTFIDNIDQALREVAGLSTFGSNLLLPRTEFLFNCVKSSTPRLHPFNKETIRLSIEPGDEYSISDSLDKESILELVNKSSNMWRPKYYPESARCVHVDLAKNGDAAGIAMGCISGIQSIERASQGKKFITQDIMFFIDIMLRIKAVDRSEIDFSKIRDFILFLRQSGFNIVNISYDGYQSVGSLQELYKSGFNVKTLSVDKTPAPYHNFRTIIIEDRLDCYEYKPFLDEFSSLVDHSYDGKHRPIIDHPRDGSKDVTDAVCGVIHNLTMIKHTETKPAKPANPLDLVKKHSATGENWFSDKRSNPFNKFFDD